MPLEGRPFGRATGDQPGTATTLLSEVSMSSPDARSLPLTVGERRALRLSARGLTVAEVAEDMCTSPSDVRSWLASAIDKLGARSKLEAVIIAARRGEIGLSP
jgi:two-component system response regulator DesR